MKISHTIPAVCMLLYSATSFSQKTEISDVSKLLKNNQIQVFNRAVTPITEAKYPGIRLSKDEGEGIAWLKGVEFSEGTIEFDVRGEDVMNHSFVGIAFHGKDNATFDAIYLRPFRFKADTEDLRGHSLQYISLPDFPWRTLREKFPNQFEHAIEPSPDPNSWIHMRIVVKGTTVSTYINGSKEPSMEVQKVTDFKKGSVGFYVADTSGGDFANISITPAN